MPDYSLPELPPPSKFIVPLATQYILGAAGIGIAAFIASMKGGSTLPKAKAALIVPKEFHTPGYGLQYGDWSLAADLVRSWCDQTNSWFVSQGGGAFEIDFQLKLSQHTWQEFKGASQGDACGDDYDWNNTFGFVPQELGWSITPPYKHWMVVVGAGGWAGGTTTDVTPGLFSGAMVLGDWALRNYFGVPSPCNTITNEVNCRSFGHEITHTCGIDSHNPVIFCGDPMDAAQRQQLYQNNYLWWGLGV